MPAYPLVPSRFSDSDANVVFWEMPPQIILPPDLWTLAIKVSQFTHYCDDTEGLMRAFQDQLWFYQQNSSFPSPIHIPVWLSSLPQKSYPHKSNWCGRVLVNLILFCPQDQFYLRRTSTACRAASVNAFHWTYPEKVSFCAEQLIWNGSMTWTSVRFRSSLFLLASLL